MDFTVVCFVAHRYWQVTSERMYQTDGCPGWVKKHDPSSDVRILAIISPTYKVVTCISTVVVSHFHMEWSHLWKKPNMIIKHLHLRAMWSWDKHPSGQKGCLVTGSWGWDEFQAVKVTTSTPLKPENERMSPKKGPSQKARIVFQPLFLRGHISFLWVSILV